MSLKAEANYQPKSQLVRSSQAKSRREYRNETLVLSFGAFFATYLHSFHLNSGLNFKINSSMIDLLLYYTWLINLDQARDIKTYIQMISRYSLKRTKVPL